MDAAASDSAAVFRQSWHVYQKFVTHNWMRHREVYATLRQLVRERFPGGVSIADFGCGDASCTLAALRDVPLSRFVAVDRVRALLEAAQSQAAGHGYRAELFEADLAVAAAQPPAAPVDVLLAAYAVHHLTTPDKQRWLSNVQRWVTPRGRLVLIDLLRRPGETRRRYLDRFHAHAANRFGAFAGTERAIVREHMEACDFPETQAGWSDLCRAAGWTTPRLAYRDPDGFYAVLTCGRA